ncbi:MAG: hypothetical protein ACOX6V_01720 [Patescibacteria group bacterium]
MATSNQEQENFEATSSGEEGNTSTTPGSSRSAVARQHMSVVAQRVEALLANPNREGGIGQQVREVAKTQNEAKEQVQERIRAVAEAQIQAQERIQEQLNKLDERKGFLRNLIGPNFKALKSLQEQIENNEERIAQLVQLKDEVSDPEELEKIEGAITALEEANTSLQEQAETEEKTPSLFGWLFKLFSK